MVVVVFTSLFVLGVSDLTYLLCFNTVQCIPFIE